MFVWRASVILEELTRHQPALSRAVQAVALMAKPNGVSEEFTRAYKKLPSLSIDHGVMERSSRAAVIPVAFTWSDVGNWSSLEEVAALDRNNNVVSGNVVDVDSRNSVLYADRRVVATIGLTDMIVVDTADATLVCPKSRAQDVKTIVETLKKQGAPEHLEHRTVFRPWGSYTVLEEGPGYKVKRVTVNPGGRLSLQLHHRRSEHWVVITGTARVTCGDNLSTISQSDTARRFQWKHSIDLKTPAPRRCILSKFKTVPILAKTILSGFRMIMDAHHHHHSIWMDE
jgi:Mannose-1-phosphate guanylyltransferase